jgi:hypothetical protein
MKSALTKLSPNCARVGALSVTRWTTLNGDNMLQRVMARGRKQTQVTEWDLSFAELRNSASGLLSAAGDYWRFGGTCCSPLQGNNLRCHIPQDGHLNSKWHVKYVIMTMLHAMGTSVQEMNG